jgi:hypothetical protein
VQTKLTIGAPNDKYEQEADRVAEQVMRAPAPQGINASQSDLNIQCACQECQEELRKQPIEEEDELIQTKFAGGLPHGGRAVIQGGALEPASLLQRASRVATDYESEDDQPQTKRVQRLGASPVAATAPPIVTDVLRGAGQGLDPVTRHFMESRFGHDFGHVRVHMGPQASASACAIQAHAYTVGRDIVFGAGQFAPLSASGRQLLAHELTHVVQQTGGAPRRDQAPTHVPRTPVQHRLTGPRLSRQNAQQTASVLSQGGVAGVQLIVNGTMNSTRIGPVSQQSDVSVIVGRLTTIRDLAQVLLPLWNSATPFTAPGAAAPVAFAPLTVDDLAQGLLAFNRFRLAIPPAVAPAVMTNWKIGMQFPLPIRVDSTTNEGILHPEPMRRLAATFDPNWVHLLTELPEVLPAQGLASLQQSVATFLTNQPSLLARGMHLGARAVANAQDNQEFILEAFNQVGAGAFELALEFMNWRVNRDITLLASQTAGATILDRIRGLLAAPPSALTGAQQSSLNRANGMLGRSTAIQAMPNICIPNRKLTWDNFTGAVPGGSSFEALTSFTIKEVAFQGNQLFQATLNQGASWVRSRSRQSSNIAVNGCQPEVNRCEAFFNGLQPGQIGHYDFPTGPSATCPAAILPGPVRANNLAECSNLGGAACTQARQADSLTRLLPHEQLHFDIACVLAHKANAARASGNAVTLAAVRARANALTNQYDAQNQSDHGCNAAGQAQWEADVAAGLPAQQFP